MVLADPLHQLQRRKAGVKEFLKLGGLYIPNFHSVFLILLLIQGEGFPLFGLTMQSMRFLKWGSVFPTCAYSMHYNHVLWFSSHIHHMNKAQLWGSFYSLGSAIMRGFVQTQAFGFVIGNSHCRMQYSNGGKKDRVKHCIFTSRHD